MPVNRWKLISHKFTTSGQTQSNQIEDLGDVWRASCCASYADQVGTVPVYFLLFLRTWVRHSRYFTSVCTYSDWLQLFPNGHFASLTTSRVWKSSGGWAVCLAASSHITQEFKWLGLFLTATKMDHAHFSWLHSHNHSSHFSLCFSSLIRTAKRRYPCFVFHRFMSPTMLLCASEVSML